MYSWLSPDVANLLIRERQQAAAAEALAQQHIAAARAYRSATRLALTHPPTLRHRLAQTLRGLAVRLDPSVACETGLTVAPTGR
jgi:hypothetical protein